MEKIDIKIDDIEYAIFKDGNVWGDGTHETTKNMLDLIVKYGVKDKTVIDVGTGTGILSILCAKLGAKSILALDIDMDSVEWARKNFKRNNVDVEVEINDITRYIDEKADVVLANLPAIVQVENVKIVKNNLKDDGILIISWLNKLKFENYVKGFEVVEHILGKEFDAYVLKT